MRQWLRKRVEEKRSKQFERDIAQIRKMLEAHRAMYPTLHSNTTPYGERFSGSSWEIRALDLLLPLVEDALQDAHITPAPQLAPAQEAR